VKRLIAYISARIVPDAIIEMLLLAVKSDRSTQARRAW
jgi:hypothetical protein